MRIKFLSVIVSFLFVSFAISSCLDSDDNTYELSSDATVHAFGLDTIYGKHYTFTIDQLKRIIYNRDSLPVGADTIIDRILIDTFRVSGWITAGINDTLFNIKDSVDFTPIVNKPEGMKFKVHAPDGSYREYTVQINRHNQDPDSLVWHAMETFSETPVSGKQKSVILGNELFVYISNTTVHQITTSEYPTGWSKITDVNLPDNVLLSTITNFQDKLYAVTGSKDVYSSEDGRIWNKVDALSGNTVTLLTGFPDKLAGICDDGSGRKFCVATPAAGTGELAWEVGEAVPAEFPVDNIYSSQFTTANYMNEAILVGLPETVEGQTVPWLSYDGKNWADLSTNSTAYCPSLGNPFIMNYGGTFYIMGSSKENKLDAIYSSVAGIAWYKTERKFLLPEEFKSITTPYTIAIDNKNFIWVIFGGDGEQNAVWRGRLNRLGFAIQ